MTEQAKPCFCGGRAVLGPIPQDGSDAEVQFIRVTGCPRDVGPNAPKASEAPVEKCEYCSSCEKDHERNDPQYRVCCHCSRPFDKPAPATEPMPCGICKGVGFFNTRDWDRIRCPNLCGDPNPILPTKDPEPKQGSAVDFEAAHSWALVAVPVLSSQSDKLQYLNLCRAYLALRARLAEVEAERDQYREILESKDEHIANLNGMRDTLRAEVERQNSQARQQAELIREWEKRDKEISAELAAAREEIAAEKAAHQEYLGRWLAQLRAELAAADQNLKTMLQAAGDEAARQLAEKDKRIEALETELSLAVVPDDHEAEERAVLQASLAAAREEIAENGALCIKLAAEKARADKAEQRVRELEDAGKTVVESKEGMPKHGIWVGAEAVYDLEAILAREQKEGGR